MTFAQNSTIGRIFLSCVWLANPASGKLECRWKRLASPEERREILRHFALAA